MVGRFSDLIRGDLTVTNFTPRFKRSGAAAVDPGKRGK